MNQEQTTTLSSLRNMPTIKASEQSDVAVSMDTVQGFEALQRIANLFTSSAIVPKQFQNNLPNCVIAVDMAMRLRANPLSVMQSLYIVHGNPAWSAKFLIATFNKCGRFSAIRYAFQGNEGADEWGCRAVTSELATGEEITGPLITIGMAKKEGWYSKGGSKWQTIPELMLRYRAAAWMVNTYAPEIAMGLSTAEEREDTYDLEQAPTGVYQVTTDSIRRQGEDVHTKESGAHPEEKKTRTRGEKSQPKKEAGGAELDSDHGDDDKETTFGQMLDEGFSSRDAQYLITCPNNGQQVDETDCATRACRKDCPAFE